MFVCWFYFDGFCECGGLMNGIVCIGFGCFCYKMCGNGSRRFIGGIIGNKFVFFFNFLWIVNWIVVICFIGRVYGEFVKI